MDFMPYTHVSVWIVMLLIQTTLGGNYCDTGTQNPNHTFMETFERSTEDLRCTARSENSVVTELYHCVNGTGIPLDNCRRGQSSNTGRVSTNCAVTIHAENVSQTFYCIERMLFGQTNQLSAHYSVVVLSDSSVTVQTSSQATTNVELATSDLSSTEEENLPTHKNRGRSENMPGGILVAVALMSILSTQNAMIV